jgi:antitoxin component YwqK of YwqJK toxin-antitoxin module
MKSNTLIEIFYQDNPSRPRYRYYTDEHGNKHGLYQHWYDNGQPWAQCEYINGQRHGLYQSWHNNGKLWTQCEYINGKIHGLFQSWLKNGQLEYYDWWENGYYVIEVFMLYSPIEIHIYQDRISIETSAFLAHVISDFDSKGIEYVIKYFS